MGWDVEPPHSDTNMKKKEIAILAVVVAVVAAILLWMNLANQDGGRRLVITVDGEVYQEIVLTEDTNMEFRIQTPYGYNDVVISNGVVDVVSADCKNQVCVETKPASRVYDKIVCLPHKVIIEIVSDSDETD